MDTAQDSRNGYAQVPGWLTPRGSPGRTGSFSYRGARCDGYVVSSGNIHRTVLIERQAWLDSHLCRAYAHRPGEIREKLTRIPPDGLSAEGSDVENPWLGTWGGSNNLYG